MSMPAGALNIIRRQATRILPHTCTIKREPSGGGAYDDPGEATAHLSDLPCFYGETTATEVMTDGTRRTITRETLRLPYDADVAETDIVTAVIDQTGTARITRARDIESVVNEGTHKELILSGVR